MKIVKLNRRFKQYKENGHTVALRFDGWNPNAQAIEKVCKDRFEDAGWLPHHSWHRYFGSRPNSNAVRPYWITFRNEMDLTLVLLSANLTK